MAGSPAAPGGLIPNRTTTMPSEISDYAELRKRIHDALLAQNPGWIDANGESPLLDSYDARFAKLLAWFTPQNERVAA